MFCMLKIKKYIWPTFQNITQSMIPNKERWHYIAVKKLPALLRRITSKHNGDYYCFNCLYSFRTKNKLESHKKVFESKDFCNAVISSEDTKILEFNLYHKSDKAIYIANLIKHHLFIYADLGSLIVKTDGCKHNLEKASSTEVSEHILPGFSMSANHHLKASKTSMNIKIA